MRRVSIVYGVQWRLGDETSSCAHFPHGCQGQPARYTSTDTVSDGFVDATLGEITLSLPTRCW
jgi:hypothetical protein